MNGIYRLVMDLQPFTLKVDEGSREGMVKKHKSWMAKIKKNTWVELPAETPVEINTASIIALRVVYISAKDLAMETALDNPSTNAFVDNARSKGAMFTGENLDSGYK